MSDGPVDGRGPAIFWKQRSVEINPSQFRDAEKTRRDDLAVRDDDDDVRCKLLQKFLNFRRADLFRLMDGDARGNCCFLHRRERDFLAPPAKETTIAAGIPV